MELTVVNQQVPLPRDRSKDGSLLVHSIFPTLQGEGPYAGHPALFLRLAGCNLQCPACDTEYTQGAARYGVQEILRALQEVRTHETLVVITGGEPFRQDITPLCRTLLANEYRVQIETNGTLWPGEDFPWTRAVVVCSPKTGKIHLRTAARVRAFKYVMEAEDVYTDGLPRTALRHTLGKATSVARPPATWRGPIYLQPMDAKDPEENEANLQACVESVLTHGYILGVQIHKIVRLP